MYLFNHLLLLIVTLSRTAQNENGALPTVESIVSGFQANRRSFPILHIFWRRKYELTAASFKRWELDAEKFDKESKDASKSAAGTSHFRCGMYRNAKGLSFPNPTLRKPYGHTPGI